jgi:4-amino-4-deoxy-L-arabinose transferase-like glycosyltransferase
MKRYSTKSKVFFAVVFIVHACFFFLALHYKRIFMGDSYEYVYMALNIKDHFLFYSANAALPLLAKNYTLRPPVYSLFLLAVYLFTTSGWVVIALQNALSIFNILYLRKTIKLIGYNEKYDWLLLLLIIAYPAQFIFANTVAPDILLQTFVLLYCRHLMLLMQQATTRHAWIASAALTLGIFTKPILLLFVPVHVLLLLWIVYRFRVCRYSLAAVLIPLVCILLYNTWNLQRTGKFHFSSIQPINALFYNVRLYQEHTLGTEKATLYINKQKAKMNSFHQFRDWYNYGNETSKSFLKEHFFSYMLFHTKYSLLFFLHPGRGEIDLFTGDLTYGRFYKKIDKRITEVLGSLHPSQYLSFMRDHPATPIMFLILFFNLLKVVGAAAFAFNRSIPWNFRAFLFLLLFYFAFMTGPIVNTRYHLPMSLIFIGCAVLGYQRLLQGRKISANITT